MKIKDFRGIHPCIWNCKNRLGAHLRDVLKEKYDLTLENIPLETPPDLNFGEFATPIAFELARKLRKAPKIIAQEIVAALGTPRWLRLGSKSPARVHQCAAGSRSRSARMITDAGFRAAPNSEMHALVEHTSINPNKAAHVGHLRNAILGDTFVRLLRAAGQKVDVQNYIDNTGVQVADVVVGFLHLEGKSLAEVRALDRRLSMRSRKQRERDSIIYCWDLYARTSQWYERGIRRRERQRGRSLRYATLHEIEQGGNETAEVAELISTAVLRRHLETMLRLDIEYDFLPRESEILHLKFWDAAFEQLKQTGVLYFENEGKNKGCWVMTRPGATDKEDKDDANGH